MRKCGEKFEFEFDLHNLSGPRHSGNLGGAEDTIGGRRSRTLGPGLPCGSGLHCRWADAWSQLHRLHCRAYVRTSFGQAQVSLTGPALCCTLRFRGQLEFNIFYGCLMDSQWRCANAECFGDTLGMDFQYRKMEKHHPQFNLLSAFLGDVVFLLKRIIFYMHLLHLQILKNIYLVRN